MAKASSNFVCQSCGAAASKWSGRCENCGEWNTIVEEQTGVPVAGARGIESFWDVLKRSLHDNYRHSSAKHLHPYVDDFTIRLNDGDVKRHTLVRLASLVTGSFGPRITYDRIIYKEVTA